MKFRIWIGSIAVVGCLSASALFAQIGDSQDKPGVVQRPLVPKELIPDAPVLTPEEAMKTFTVAKGYRLELAASEPQVQEPVAITFDPDGRIWVAEMRGYMPDLDGQGEDEPTGRIVCLEDRDGDGFYEHSSIFIDGLVMPRALLRVADGLLVGAPPELAFYRDTDGDGKADTKEVLAIDYGVKVDPKRPHLANPERAPNSLLWAFDNWIYSAAYTRRFRYRDGVWEMGTTSFRGQWGLAQDAYGRLYYGSNSDHIRVDVIDAKYLARQSHYPSMTGTNVNAALNQEVWPIRVNPGINRGYRPEMLRDGRLKEFTAAGGQGIYGGDRLPEMQGDYFIPEPAGNLVRRSRLKIEGEGGTVKSQNAYESAEFIASTDERFRPVNVATGPDGSFWVVDFYRGILQHRISLTSYLRQQIVDRDLDKGLHLGRLYRVVAEGAKTPLVETPPANLQEWVTRLEHPNSWWRERAQRTLVEAADLSVVEAVRAVAREGKTAIGRVHALWTLEGIGKEALDLETVKLALAAKDAVLQAHAIRLAEPWLNGEEGKELRSQIFSLAEGDSAEVRLQAVLSLGDSKNEEIEDQLVNLVRKHEEEVFLTDAFLSGLMNRELILLRHLHKLSSGSPADAPTKHLMTGLARGVLGSRDVEALGAVVAMAGEAVEQGDAAKGAAMLQGLVPIAGSSRRPILFEGEPAAWPVLAESAPTRAVVGKLVNTLVWPGKAGVTAVVEAPALTKEQQALYDMGEPLYATICASCHQADGRGQEGLAPPLLDSEWVLGPMERTTRIVLHGVRGPIRVLGKTHTGDMPPLGVLPDEQIAAILTYVRRAWGHTASPVEPAQVKHIRKETAQHTDAWSPEELRQIP